MTERFRERGVDDGFSITVWLILAFPNSLAPKNTPFQAINHVWSEGNSLYPDQNDGFLDRVLPLWIPPTVVYPGIFLFTII